jgi:hypothetical protein
MSFAMGVPAKPAQAAQKKMPGAARRASGTCLAEFDVRAESMQRATHELLQWRITMKTMMKGLLVSAVTIACASGVYAQGAGGAGGGAGGSAGGGGGTSAGAAGGGPSGGGGAGMSGGSNQGATPGGNTLNQPSMHGTGRDTGGYGTPGTTRGGMGTGSGSGTSTEPGANNPSDNPSNQPNYQQRQ